MKTVLAFLLVVGRNRGLTAAGITLHSLFTKTDLT